MAAYFDDIGISNIISWNKGIQYLDYEVEPQIRKVSLNTLLKGDYKTTAKLKYHMLKELNSLLKHLNHLINIWMMMILVGY